MPVDPQMPTLLRDSPGNLVPPASSVNTGANTPLQPLSVNTGGGSSNIANAAIAQIARATAAGRMGAAAITGMPPHPLLNSSHLANAPSIAAMNLNRSQREMSGGPDNKRRRLDAHLGPLPRSSSGLARQASLGPGTPKVSTPGDSRAGSAGPRPPKKGLGTKRPDPRRPLKKVGKAGLQKKASRRITGMSRASPSTTGEDSGVSEEGSDEENGSFQVGDEDDGIDVDDEGTDDTKYCYCQKVSYGDMVACDNADCKGQWFHWDCAGLTSGSCNLPPLPFFMEFKSQFHVRGHTSFKYKLLTLGYQSLWESGCVGTARRFLEARLERLEYVRRRRQMFMVLVT
jgi:inhibitor of growth protein 3